MYSTDINVVMPAKKFRCLLVVCALLFGVCAGRSSIAVEHRAAYNRSIQNIDEAEKALAAQEEVYSIINLRFFGTYGAMDEYIEQLHKEVCLKKPPQILKTYAARKTYPYRQRALSIMTETMNRIVLVAQAEKNRLKNAWSYRYFLRKFAELDCVLAQADALLMTEDPIDRLLAQYLYDNIDGFRHADESLRRLRAEAQAAVKQPGAITQYDIKSYDIFDVKLGMSINDALAIRPQLVMTEDNRHNQTMYALKAIYEKTGLKDNNIKMEILFASEEYGAGAFDLDYELDTQGLNKKQTAIIIEKVFEKYGLPTKDLTDETQDFDKSMLQQRLQQADKLPAEFCWGECSTMARSKSLAPGQRLIFRYEPASHRLVLRLFDNGLEPVHNNLEQQWQEFSEDLFKESPSDSAELIF